MVGLKGGRSAGEGDDSSRGHRAEPSGAKGASQRLLAQAQSAGQLSSYCAVQNGTQSPEAAEMVELDDVTAGVGHGPGDTGQLAV